MCLNTAACANSPPHTHIHTHRFEEHTLMCIFKSASVPLSDTHAPAHRGAHRPVWDADSYVPVNDIKSHIMNKSTGRAWASPLWHLHTYSRQQEEADGEERTKMPSTFKLWRRRKNCRLQPVIILNQESPVNEIIIISTLCVLYKLTTAVTARRGPPRWREPVWDYNASSYRKNGCQQGYKEKWVFTKLTNEGVTCHPGLQYLHISLSISSIH